MRGFVVGLVAIFTVLPMSALGVAADGMSHVYVPTYDTWELAVEDSQFAMISLVDGKENLIIQASVDADSLLSGAEAVWFFPIPSKPDDANITIVRTISSLDGYFVSSLAKREVDRNFIWVYGTQLYPLIVMGTMTLNDGEWYSAPRTLMPEEFAGTTDDFSGVVISEHVEAFGLASELISATDSSAIGDYLDDKGLDLSTDAVDLLDEYVGEDYSFVVSWISDMVEFTNESVRQYGYDGYVYRLGVSVTFPTERMYYPLRLTSIYGDHSIPMVIQVLGRAEPVRFENDDEEGLVDVYRCLSPSYYVSLENAWFFQNELSARDINMGTIEDVEFTIITMAGPSSYLTDDLWIEPHWSFKTSVAESVYENSWTVVLASLVGASVLASVSTGLIVYRQFGPDLKLFAALGLMNLLTLIGMVVGIYVLDIEKNFLKPQTERMVWPRRKEFLFAFTIVFLGYALLFHSIALLAL